MVKTFLGNPKEVPETFQRKEGFPLRYSYCYGVLDPPEWVKLV